MKVSSKMGVKKRLKCGY